MAYRSKNELKDQLEGLRESERNLAKDPKDIYGQAVIAEGYSMAADTAKELGDNRTAFGLFRKSYGHFSDTQKLGIQTYLHRIAKLRKERRLTKKLQERAKMVVNLPPIGPFHDLDTLKEACKEMKYETDRFRRRAALDKVTQGMNPIRRGLVKLSKGYLASLFFILTILFSLPSLSGNAISTNYIKASGYLGILFFIIFLFLSWFYLEKKIRLYNLKKNYIK